MADIFKRLTKLVKDTGDKVIVYDSNAPEEAVVIIGLDQYERFLTAQDLSQANLVKESQNLIEKSLIKQDLTEEVLTDIINRDISVYKNQEKAPYLAEESEARCPWPLPINKAGQDK
jgi:PHD/YefM family antitoxin component YafN of YafNO toxin-antitoxin module